MGDAARQVAMITGAGSGIGRATATAFAERGYATALLDRNTTGGIETENRLRTAGHAAIFIDCDVADDTSVERAVARTVAEFGRLDAAFNAAGIGGEQGKFTAETSSENWHRVLAVDLTGVWHCMRHQIPAMLASGGGSIVNCSSTAGLTGAATMSAYCAAKHGVIGLTKAAALEYVRMGVRVNAVCPGMIETPMSTEGANTEFLAKMLGESPAGRFGRPEEVASAVLWLCDAGASFVTGQAIAVDGAWTTQ